jgi:multisubunit Na+/H+ antiporter MnhC subunit
MNYEVILYAITCVLIGISTGLAYRWWCVPLLRERWSLYPEKLVVMAGFVLSLTALEGTIFTLVVISLSAVCLLLVLRYRIYNELQEDRDYMRQLKERDETTHTNSSEQ